MKSKSRSDAEVMAAFRAAGQGHVLRWWDELARRPRAADGAVALRGPRRTPRADRRCPRRPGQPGAQGRPELPDYVRLPCTPEEKSAHEQARAAGERLLRAGKVAAVMVAGGQGTRLGFDAPKGTFPIGPVSDRSLFQIHAERILATRRRTGGALPWYIMTSDATDGPTKGQYFEKHAWFGLPREDVQPFPPAHDARARPELPTRPHRQGPNPLSPNGHGGTLLALAESGMADDMERRGVEEISYFQVDNGLVPAADPVFLGFHSLKDGQMSSKALMKREPEEPDRRVRARRKRHYGPRIQRPHRRADARADRRRAASLRPRQHRHSRHPRGFRRAETRSGFKLPFHLAEKSSPFLDESGALVQPKDKNVYKFETFIFDALRDARRTVVLEVRREEEFSPLKNATGKDSPETCRRDMSALYASWLEQSGVRIPRDERGAPKHPIEISPLFALDAAELAGKIPKDLNTAGRFVSIQSRNRNRRCLLRKVSNARSGPDDCNHPSSSPRISGRRASTLSRSCRPGRNCCWFRPNRPRPCARRRG